VDVDEERRRADHVLRELGFGLTRTGDELHGRAPIVPEMWVPGTEILRVSILAAWADITAGHLALDIVAPRVPVTLELDVHVYDERPDPQTVHAASRLIKAGRSVLVAGIDFTDHRGEPLAVAMASFMVSPDPQLTLERADATPEDIHGFETPRLTMPYAARARCTIREPGVATIPRTLDGLNASGTINGGLLALAVEEAALSRTPNTTLSSMTMRYLRPARIGPAVATADVTAGLGRVEVRDEGNDGRVAIVATTRTFSAENSQAA
jgi:acyl-coenzyme A thioesterase PaaI-like protein